MAEATSVLTSKSPTDGQIILHLDMDCFFVACERLRNPDLQGEPVVVGGGFESDPPRGAVATASYEAREHGVHSAQPMGEALEKLPRRKTAEGGDQATGIYLRGDHEYYQRISDEVMAIVEQYGDTVRKVSIDEAYLDITTQTTWGTAATYARELKTRIDDEVGVVGSIGVAPTLSCAKIASDYDKPDGLRVVKPDAVESFLAPLDIGDIHGVGPVSAEKFHRNGIHTAGDLASLSTQEVLDRFGSRTTTLYDRVRGIDPREVQPVGKPKSISKEKSIEPTSDEQVKEAILEQLSEQVNQRAKSKNARYRTVGIKVVETPFERNTRERSLVGPVRDRELVSDIAVELLGEFVDSEVRKLGVSVSNLDFFEAEQTRISMWTEETTSPPIPDFAQVRLGQRRLEEFY